MQIKILQVNDLENVREFVGGKTFNLKKCLEFGFNVPPFVALPSYVSENLFNDLKFREEVVFEVCQILPVSTYAVRSSALVEDGTTQSFAGQFMTKLNVPRENLSMAIEEVLTQAKDFLDGDLNKFSLIIQEYVKPSVSGVAFTRNPNGGRDMIVEYGFYEGEKIVGGVVKPEKVNFYWGDSRVKLPQFFLDHQIIEKFKFIEKKFEYPQDIEWCVSDEIFYVLQTRPITTFSKLQYRQALFLEESLSTGHVDKYFFEKTELSEIAPRPALITFNLLEMIYKDGGPVAKVYENYGIVYEDKQFLHIIGNELFVNKERELKSLLPAYSYLSNNNFSPKFVDWSNFFRTVKNLIFLNTVKTKDYDKLFVNLKICLESSLDGDFGVLVQRFLDDYKIIFEVNFLSLFAVKKMELLLKKENIKFSDILQSSGLFVDVNKYKVEVHGDFQGNSLDILDDSDFINKTQSIDISNQKVLDWWAGLPQYKKNLFLPKIIEAIIYNQLRELGRWLTVKNITAIRFYLLGIAGKFGFVDESSIFFASIFEVLNNHLDEAVCSQRKAEYLKFNEFSLPVRITSSVCQTNTQLLGISAGIASGILVNEQYFDVNRDNSPKVILCVDVLSPSLVKYFDQICGIITNNGGMLSHLAIIARENKIPVVAGVALPNDNLKFGDSVQIDGSAGIIIKL